MPEFTSKSGKEVVINCAPFADAKRLKSAIWKEAAAAGIKLDDMKADASTLLNTFLLVDGSPLVDAALAPCLLRCTRDKQKITDSTFDSAEARQDYYEIVFACVKENIGPLFESLLSLFSETILSLAKPKKADPILES